MRHSIRLDLTFGLERIKKSFSSNDPPLTDEGVTKAYAAGMMIIAYKYQLEHMFNKGRPFDKFIIESSPFLRTM